ncbi:MAG TPA: hypothetical protein VGG24_07355 [Paraburkholderia sp.]|jgi:hypothetical protein
MKDPAPVRVWALLARTRQLRVERLRRALNDARASAGRAASDVASQRTALAEHDAMRRSILASCSWGGSGAALWRMTLRRHDAGKFALESALFVACDVKQKADGRVVAALHALQKEMRGLDDARERLRRLMVSLQDVGDPDD